MVNLLRTIPTAVRRVEVFINSHCSPCYNQAQSITALNSSLHHLSHHYNHTMSTRRTTRSTTQPLTSTTTSTAVAAAADSHSPTQSQSEAVASSKSTSRKKASKKKKSDEEDVEMEIDTTPTTAANSSSSSAAAAASLTHSAKGATILQTIRTHLSAAGQPSKSPSMQSYMKSAMPYHGVPSAGCKQIWKQVLSDEEFTSHKEWASTLRHIWDHATHREERYGVLALARMTNSKAYRSELSALDLYQYLVSSGAWWDYVDELASHHIGDVLRAHPVATKKLLREWSLGSDMWLRRAAIIAQLSSKGDQLDLPFLFDMIQPALSSTEFFLRKAIGWSLRQVAKERPKEVVEYVISHEAHLSALSLKEALKHFGGTVQTASRLVLKKSYTSAKNEVAAADVADADVPEAKPTRKRKSVKQLYEEYREEQEAMEDPGEVAERYEFDQLLKKHKVAVKGPTGDYCQGWNHNIGSRRGVKM